MTTLETLKKEAKDAARWRGHDGAICVKCDAGVWVDTDPPPNGIDIYGGAVALNCPTGPNADNIDTEPEEAEDITYKFD